MNTYVPAKPGDTPGGLIPGEGDEPLPLSLRLSPKDYHRPPDDYTPPTRCEQCHWMIMYGPVIGGHVWKHVARADHDAVMRPEGWWDVATGETRYGNGRDRLIPNPNPAVTIG